MFCFYTASSINRNTCHDLQNNKKKKMLERNLCVRVRVRVYF
jgi:hypothetical protein